MIRLTDLLKEAEEFQQLPTEMKKHFLEIISTYGQHREGMSRKSDIRQIAETLGGIADAAQEYTLREGGDWFDRVTIKRNMNELKKLQTSFEKEAVEAQAQQQRLEALYEDMGHVLGRYFEIADVSEQVMKQRLGLQECSVCNKTLTEGVSQSDITKIKDIVQQHVDGGGSLIGLGTKLKSAGYKSDFTTSGVPHHWIKFSGGNFVICNKKYADDADFVVGDIAGGKM